MCCWVVFSIDRSLFLEDEHVLSFLVYSILYFLFFLSLCCLTHFPSAYLLWHVICFNSRSDLQRGQYSGSSEEDPAQDCV
jgi:hypothetical protein